LIRQADPSGLRQMGGQILVEEIVVEAAGEGRLWIG
jgi:hypothetical protein